MTDYTITSALNYLRNQQRLLNIAIDAIDELLIIDVEIPPVMLAPVRAAKPTRKAVTPARAAKKPTVAAPAMPVPLGGLRGRVLLQLRASSPTTAEEVGLKCGIRKSAASSALQALQKSGLARLTGKSHRAQWTAVPHQAAEPEMEVVWNGTKDAMGEASLIGDRPRKAG